MVEKLSLAPGDPHLLGAHACADGVLFGVWSPEAEAVWLCLFDDAGQQELRRLPLHPGPQGVWHGWLAGSGVGLVYGYRAAGRWAPEQGLRFNPQRLLLDPYAQEIVGRYAGDLSAYLDHDPMHPALPHPHDNGPLALKARVLAPVEANGPQAPLRAPAGLGCCGPRCQPASQRVIAEVHVKNATACCPAVPEALRGTYAGLAHPALIDHWKRLGITTLELMPVQQRVDEGRLQALGLSNHWGYSPIGYFAAEPRYASGVGGLTPAQELRSAITTLRQAGFEVILDVVYNHTGETDLHGPTLGFRGLANRHWYRHDPRHAGRYMDWTGCGNTLNLSEPMVLRLVIDSMRHWVQSYGVDGFRFDLAPALARNEQGRFSAGAAFFAAVEADPVLRRVLLIAEPWDLGPSPHQLGGFPPHWLEWNDQARDALRAYWLQPHEYRATRAELASRLTGSHERFGSDPRRPRPPTASINFITAHDGFSLRDLVSYNERHNLANGEGNRDGHGDNLSWNGGTEGSSHDPALRMTRACLQRALLASLLFSRGTPMLLMGDEWGHSQQGNNNAYCQDSPISWIDWAHGDAYLAQFMARLVALRQADPALHADEWLTGRPGPDGLPDVAWARLDGQPLSVDDWHDPQQRGLRVHLAPAGYDHETLLVFNPSAEADSVELPSLQRGSHWHALLDTRFADGQPEAHGPRTAGPYPVPARCVQLWCSQAALLQDPLNQDN